MSCSKSIRVGLSVALLHEGGSSLIMRLKLGLMLYSSFAAINIEIAAIELKCGASRLVSARAV
jgi:hypothetical protein